MYRLQKLYTERIEKFDGTRVVLEKVSWIPIKDLLKRFDENVQLVYAAREGDNIYSQNAVQWILYFYFTHCLKNHFL